MVARVTPQCDPFRISAHLGLFSAYRQAVRQFLEQAQHHWGLGLYGRSSCLSHSLTRAHAPSLSVKVCYEEALIWGCPNFILVRITTSKITAAIDKIHTTKSRNQRLTCCSSPTAVFLSV